MRHLLPALSLALCANAPAQADALTFVGRVVDVLGEPVPAARIELVRDDRVAAATATDGEGVYRLGRVPAAGGDLHVSAPGKTRVVLPWRGPTTPRTRHVTLMDGGVLSGTVVDAAGRPLAGATVAVASRVHSQCTTTDAAGRFELGGVPLHRVELRAFCERGAVARSLRLVGDTRCELQLPAASPELRRVTVSGLPAAAIAGASVQVFCPTLALLPNRGRAPLREDGTAELLLEDWSLVEVVAPGFATEPRGRLARGGGPTLEFRCSLGDGTAAAAPTRLTGRLRDARGRPVRDAQLTLRNCRGRDIGLAAVDADGRFGAAVEPCPERLYLVGLPLEHGALVDAEMTIDDGLAWVPVRNPEDPIELETQPTWRLECAVRDADGTLLALAPVVIADRDAPFPAFVETCCDHAGRCSVWLPQGHFELLVTGHDGRVCRATVRMPADAQAPAIAWRPVPTGSVRGRLLDERGQPLPGATLLLACEGAQRESRLCASERQIVRVSTDRDGNFRCRGLPAGNWTAVALDERDVPPAKLIVMADATVELTLGGR